jgi:hypothetical protein
VSPENCFRPPHIATDQGLDEVWQHKVGQSWDGKSMKVGLVWAGDPRHGNDMARSISLAKFLPHLPVPGAQFFSFQVGQAAEQLKQGDDRVVELGSEFRNFDDTASALRSMDLLISVDTSVAHLAGCIGVPTWWLLPLPSEWRHLMSGDISPWYEKTRLFRETAPRDWDSVLKRVFAELRENAACPRQMPSS